MKNRLLLFIAILFAVGIFIFIGCQKNTPSSQNQQPDPEINVRIVPLGVAQSIAQSFVPNIFFNASNPTNNSPVRSTLRGDNAIKDETTINDSYGMPAIYIFNFTNNKGFLFVSADSSVQPILAFIRSGNFKKDTVPSGIIQWANKTIENIEIVRKGLYDNSMNAKIAWDKYLDENKKTYAKPTNESINKLAPPPPTDDPCDNLPPSTSVTVGPLLPVTWGQSCTYNELCPDKSCTDGCGPYAVTGCVATAVAQIIRYWEPPTSYGYNYASMPDTHGNSEVQRLMKDVGLKVNMAYKCAVDGGSGAYNDDIPGALKNHFGFSSANYSSYNISSYQTVKANLSNQYPVILGGYNDETNNFLGIWYTYQNGHTWVCDGYHQFTENFCIDDHFYSETLLYFDMNWGWHESTSNPPLNYPDYNGWFAFADWTISGAGAGGSDLNFQYAKDMVKDIHP